MMESFESVDIWGSVEITVNLLISVSSKKMQSMEGEDKENEQI